MKDIKYVFLAAFGIALMSAAIVFAQSDPGGQSADQMAIQQQAMFQQTADMLGISIDDVKNGWADGKTVSQIAQEHNISQQQLKQKMADYSKRLLQDELNILVSKGVISQDQANRRMQVVQNKIQSGNGGGSGCGGMGGRCPMMQPQGNQNQQQVQPQSQ